MSQFDWPITQKRLNVWDLPKIEGSILEYIAPCLWPSYIGWRRTTVAEPYGIKVKCYWEHPWGTQWELDGNMLGTKEYEKNPPPHPPPPNPNPKLKGKKTRHFECMLSLPIGYMNFLFPKLFVTIFGLG